VSVTIAEMEVVPAPAAAPAQAAHAPAAAKPAGPPLDPAARATEVRQVAKALAHLHQRHARVRGH
jgi:hypothetical protein